MKDIKEKTKSIANELNEQKKWVNVKVDSMFDDTMEQYTKLMNKRDTIESNKQEVEQTIVFLNQQKNEELSKTWKIVNTNFSEIFSTLLPGAMAKLELHNADEGVEHGLELKVGFNNSWKQSLSELSGG